MDIIETRHIRHVFGEVHQKKGAVLCYVTPWGSKRELFLNEVLRKHPEVLRKHGVARKAASFDTVIEIFGSLYELSFRRKTEVECFTIREANQACRPLGLSKDGPHVTQLHFFRFTGQRQWNMLKPGCVVTVPAAESVAAQPRACLGAA